MRPPGWMVQVGRGKLSDDGRRAVFTFRLKRWHPGLWRAVVREWWRNR